MDNAKGLKKLSLSGAVLAAFTGLASVSMNNASTVHASVIGTSLVSDKQQTNLSEQQKAKYDESKIRSEISEFLHRHNYDSNSATDDGRTIQNLFVLKDKSVFSGHESGDPDQDIANLEKAITDAYSGKASWHSLSEQPLSGCLSYSNMSTYNSGDPSAPHVSLPTHVGETPDKQQQAEHEKLIQQYQLFKANNPLQLIENAYQSNNTHSPIHYQLASAKNVGKYELLDPTSKGFDSSDVLQNRFNKQRQTISTVSFYDDDSETPKLLSTVKTSEFDGTQAIAGTP